MSLRRILLGLRIHTHNLNLSKSFPYRNHHFSPASFSASAVAAVHYPIGKDLSSLPLALTQKLPQNPILYLMDGRPISLRYRFNSMIELSQLDQAAEISRVAVLETHRHSPDTVTNICNEIIRAMSEAKRYDEAIALFHYFFNESNLVPNIVSFNHIIKVHCDENRVDEALELFRHVRVLNLENEDTYRFLTKALVSSGRIYEAIGMVKAVTMFDPVVYNYLISFFLDQENSHTALRLFDDFCKLPLEIYPYEKSSEDDESDLYDDLEYSSYSGYKRDTRGNKPDMKEFRKLDEEEYNQVLDEEYNKIAMVDATFVDYWFKQGNKDNAMKIYKSILPRGDDEWIYAETVNTLLRILLAHGKKSEAWELFKDVMSWEFDAETINIMVNECFELDMVTKAMDTFRTGEKFSECYRNIIKKFCERGMMSEAEDLFDEMWSDKDLVLSYEVDTFRSMINGFVKVGRLHDAQRMLKKMVDTSLLKVSIPQAD